MLNIVAINVFSGLKNGFYYSGKPWGYPTVIMGFFIGLFAFYDVNTWLSLSCFAVSSVFTLLMAFRVFASEEPESIKNKRLHLYEHFIKNPLYLAMLIEGIGTGSILFTIFLGNFLFNIPIQVSVGRPAISWNQGKPEEDIYIFGKKFMKPRFNSGWSQLIIAVFMGALLVVSEIYNFNYNIYELWQHVIQLLS